jgi:hypothetical protein
VAVWLDVEISSSKDYKAKVKVKVKVKVKESHYTPGQAQRVPGV